MAGDEQRVPIDALRITVVWADPLADDDAAESTNPLAGELTAALAKRVGQLGMQRDGVAFRIPVHVRWKAWGRGAGSRPPRPIDLDGAASNLVIVLNDEALAVSREDWEDYLANLVQGVEARDEADLILTIRLSHDQIAFPGLRPIQGVDWRAAASGDRRTVDGLLLRLFSILLARRRQASAGPPRSFPVFLSHAKADGETVAMRFLDYGRAVQPAPELGLFFDAQSLHAGAAYADQFREHIGSGALIAIESDAYHRRPWCNWEILEAKRLGRAIVVMDVSMTGTGRVFPYIGNVPLVRIDRPSGDVDVDVGEAAVQRVLSALLDEALRINVWRSHAQARLKAHGIDPKATEILGRPPELADVAMAATARPGVERVVYPDPPLNEHEASLVSRAFPHIMLQSLGELDASVAAPRDGGHDPLRDRVVSVSISPPPAQDLARLGRLPGDLDAAMEAIFAPLVQAGATVTYGGRIRSDPRVRPGANFTLLLAQDLAVAYRLAASGRKRPFRHYLRHGELTTCSPDEVFEHAMNLGTAADIHLVALGENVGRLRAENSVVAFRSREGQIVIARDGREFAAIPAIESLYRSPVKSIPQRAADLTAMRTLMAHETDARIVVGGTCAPSLTGRSGVAEEAALTIEAGKPLLVVGAFGGAAKDIAVALGLLDAAEPRFERTALAYFDGERDRRAAYLASIAALSASREMYLASLKASGILELARALAATESLYAQSVLVLAILRRTLTKPAAP